MRCVNCGQEFEGNFCPNCGTKAMGVPSDNGGMYVNNVMNTGTNPYLDTVYVPEQPTKQKKKPIYKRAWFWIIIAVVIIVFIAIISQGGESEISDYGNGSNSGYSDGDSSYDSNDYNNNVSGDSDVIEDITTTTTKVLSESEILAQIDRQSFKVISTKYEVQDEEFKSLYPDLLQAVIKNNTKYEIKNAVIAFVAWDKNNLPVKIVGKHDFSDGSYVSEVSYNDINLVPGATYGNDSGLGLDRYCDNIAKFKAIAVSYETFDGEKWENPYYADWCELYEGKKLK